MAFTKFYFKISMIWKESKIKDCVYTTEAMTILELYNDLIKELETKADIKDIRITHKPYDSPIEDYKE